MSADMLIATLACPAGTEIDFDAGRSAVDEITDIETFSNVHAEVEDLITDFDPALHLDPKTDNYTLRAMKDTARKIIDDLDNAFTGDTDVDERTIGGYTLFLTGGLSYGDAPTEEAEAIWNAVEFLPHAVLRAMNISMDYSRPPARKTGSTGPVTDTDVVDAIQLGLATQSEWTGSECLEWIANLIGRVRSHPGASISPKEALETWTKEFNFDPTDDGFLTMYVDDEADENPEEKTP